MNHPLKAVVERVLAEWAMMLVDPALNAAEAFDASQDFYEARATCEGVFTGWLVVLCQQEFLNTLTVNVLGLDGEDEIRESDRLDALRELANIICGNFMTEAYGADTPFTLPCFSVRNVNYAEIEGKLLDQTSGVALLADDHPLLVTFDLVP